jgi:hypothetical protein
VCVRYCPLPLKLSCAISLQLRGHGTADRTAELLVVFASGVVARLDRARPRPRSIACIGSIGAASATASGVPGSPRVDTRHSARARTAGACSAGARSRRGGRAQAALVGLLDSERGSAWAPHGARTLAHCKWRLVSSGRVADAVCCGLDEQARALSAPG